MEKKRKLPARAAARSEQSSKRRNTTPSEPTPTPAPEEPVVVEEPPPPLPKSVQAGKPLPTVEQPQQDDLPSKDFQSVQESGVLSESLSRSRQRWISEGIFEKYWTKPTKKKGVLIEDPNNPPKESMTKLGQVTITVEPHVFEATMYGVKDPKPPAPPAPPPAVRQAVLQYGPPNGVMPPPPTPPAKISTPATPSQPASQTPTQTPAQAPAKIPATAAEQGTAESPASKPAPEPAKAPVPAPQALPPVTPPLPSPAMPAVTAVGTATPTPATPTPAAPPSAAALAAPQAPPPVAAPRPMASPRGMESVLSPGAAAAQPPPVPTPSAATPAAPARPVSIPPGAANPMQSPRVPPMVSAPASVAAAGRPPSFQPIASPVGSVIKKPPPLAPPAGRPAAGLEGAPPSAPGKPAPGTDPIILTLAEKAGEDPQLRDLMRRVAQGDAQKHELERFQSIIDEITAESKRKGTPLGPSADRLLVDSKTVRYFADEVNAILGIVLASNPKQTSATLHPPEGSDPLVVLLVRTALDDLKTREMVRRIAENRPQFSDATDLKGVLDRLKNKLLRDRERQLVQSPLSVTSPALPKANGVVNGHANPSPTPAPAAQPPQQALRSKGPPPPPKPDISQVVFEFAGGNGDRYLFPKFSILEYVQVATGHQVIASFLIVRKGSTAEYPLADPALDYYQPVTIRLYAAAGRHLENLARVVAPQDEVRRYMDGIMDTMTRAEYILLAMRLPRGEHREEAVATAIEEKPQHHHQPAVTNGSTPKHELQFIHTQNPNQPHLGVLWTAKVAKPEMRELAPKTKIYSKDEEEDQYQGFINKIRRKEVVEE